MGFIKIDDKFKKWRWRKYPNMVSTWLYILQKCNYEDGEIGEVKLKKGQCIFGREQAAEDIGISVQSLRTCINRLKSTGEITIKSTNEFSIITAVNYAKYRDNDITSNQQINQQINQRVTSNQPASNHITEETEETEETDIKELKDIMSGNCREIIDYLNKRTGSKYKYTESNTKHIKARLSEGFTVQDCKDVVDKKCVEWINSDMEKYLRPETLFNATKFQNYLNQKVVGKKEDFLERKLREEHEKNEQGRNGENPNDPQGGIFGF